MITFSNEGFERFEAMLREDGTPEDSLRWLLRDGIFGATFFRPPQLRSLLFSRRFILLLPGGWIIWFALQRVRALLGFFPPPPAPEQANSHILCVSPRSNHVKRVGPIIAQSVKAGTCFCWTENAEVREPLKNVGAARFYITPNAWAHTLKFEDVLAAGREGFKVNRLLYGSPQLKSAGVPCQARPGLSVRFMAYLYIGIFLAWCRFWRKQMLGTPAMVLTTFEKTPMAKAMLAIARERGTPQCIHWTHGLRHASQRSTFATELWCLTEQDALYFKSRVPPGCKAIHRPSPESEEWLSKFGRLGPEHFDNPTVIHFLVLGCGFDPDYSFEMGIADLRIVQSAMLELGDRVEWRFRPHPGNIARFREQLAMLKMTDIDYSSRQLEEDLRWSHAVGSPFSSVCVDIAPTGRKIFWISDGMRSLWSIDHFIKEGYGTHLDRDHAASRIREVFNLKK